MAADEFKEQEKDTVIPGHGSPEKKNLIIAGVVVVMLIIAVIAVIVIDPSPAGKGTPQAAVIINSTLPEREYPSCRPTLSKIPSVRQVPRLSDKH